MAYLKKKRRTALLWIQNKINLQLTLCIFFAQVCLSWSCVWLSPWSIWTTSTKGSPLTSKWFTTVSLNILVNNNVHLQWSFHTCLFTVSSHHATLRRIPNTLYVIIYKRSHFCVTLHWAWTSRLAQSPPFLLPSFSFLVSLEREARKEKRGGAIYKIENKKNKKHPNCELTTSDHLKTAWICIRKSARNNILSHLLSSEFKKFLQRKSHSVHNFEKPVVFKVRLSDLNSLHVLKCFIPVLPQQFSTHHFSF